MCIEFVLTSIYSFALLQLLLVFNVATHLSRKKYHPNVVISIILHLGVECRANYTNVEKFPLCPIVLIMSLITNLRFF